MDKSKLAVDTYEKIAGKYAAQYFDDLTDIPYIDRFLDLLPRHGDILDIGSGPGQFDKYMLEKGFRVVGIDFSKEMIKIAKAKVPNGDFRMMDMRHLDFPENTFDGIYAAYSLIHIPSEEIVETLTGFYKVLKNGGYIEIGVQQGEADKIINEPFMPSEKMFFNFFTPERLSKFVEEAGFSIISQELMSIDDAETMSDKVIYTIAKKAGK
jgi:ubiquinone/menaquinone biosynthesis C-methylase UbiE